NVHTTTYVKQPKNAYTVASIVVKAINVKPMTEEEIPIMSTVCIDMLPVTVGRFCVRSIFSSKSTSYQLLIISAPAIVNVLPNIVNKNKSKFAINDAFVKYNANQKPVKTGKTFATKTILFNK